MKRLTSILAALAITLPLMGQGPLVVRRMDVNVKSRSAVNRAFTKLESIPMDKCNWPDRFPYAPECSFRIFHTGEYLCIRFEKEEYLCAALESRRGGDVCYDSCVEFFISPDGDDNFYNYEFSCIGMPNIEHNGIGRPCIKAEDRTYDSVITRPSLGRKFFEERLGANRWSLDVMIPVTALFDDSYTSWNELGSAKANFYTCGDRLSLRHYLTWAPVKTDRPQFHSPDYFEQIIFE